jgi:hypothetical protein
LGKRIFVWQLTTFGRIGIGNLLEILTFSRAAILKRQK